MAGILEMETVASAGDLHVAQGEAVALLHVHARVLRTHHDNLAPDQARLLGAVADIDQVLRGARRIPIFQCAFAIAALGEPGSLGAIDVQAHLFVVEYLVVGQPRVLGPADEHAAAVCLDQVVLYLVVCRVACAFLFHDQAEVGLISHLVFADPRAGHIAQVDAVARGVGQLRGRTGG